MRNTITVGNPNAILFSNLEPGAMFRYPAGNTTNVYMKIADVVGVFYGVLLISGVSYVIPADKEVTPVFKVTIER